MSKKSKSKEQTQTMRGVINHLMQLQELILIRDEQRAIHGPGTDLGAINKHIDDMTASLDPNAATIFNRLYKKDHIIMAPMSDGSCSMCGMHLAISQIQSVKLCREIVPCPNCVRIIYDPTGPKWVGDQKRGTTERKSGIARFSSPDLMIPELEGDTAAEVISELATALEKAQFVDDASKLTQGAIERENILGTGIGHHMAFPHVRGVEGGGLALVFGVSRKGVDFGGVSKTPANLIFFCTIPTAVSAFYLRLLAGISDSFAKDANYKAAMEADSPEVLWKVLTKATRYTIK